MSFLYFIITFCYNIYLKGVINMAQAVNVNFRMDADLKKSMETQLIISVMKLYKVKQLKKLLIL